MQSMFCMVNKIINNWVSVRLELPGVTFTSRRVILCGGFPYNDTCIETGTIGVRMSSQAKRGNLDSSATCLQNTSIMRR